MKNNDNLTITQDGPSFVVTYKHLNIFGIGITEEEAKKDFKYEVDKYFEFYSLRKHREQLMDEECLYSL